MFTTTAGIKEEHMATYELYYNEHLVCAECGKQDYHMNFSFHLPEANLYDDEECATWCHICETEASLLEDWEYELKQKSLKENKQ